MLWPKGVIQGTEDEKPNGDKIKNKRQAKSHTADDKSQGDRKQKTNGTRPKTRSMRVDMGVPFWIKNGTQNRSKVGRFLDLILKRAWESLFRALGLRLSSQKTPKTRPKRESTQKHYFH